jgi:hypothetical protein
MRRWGSKPNIFVCDDNNAWRTLKIVNAPICRLTQLGDIHPFTPAPVVNSPFVIMDNCDKNFVYYWLDDRIFPRLSTFILASHPCEPKVARWMQRQTHTTFYVREDHFPKIQRYGASVNMSHIRQLTRSDYNNVIENLS